jgi:hypothetical protein
MAKALNSAPFCRRPFSPSEDVQLLSLVNQFRGSSWDFIAAQFGNRSARQCRERYVNYLSPDIRVAPWTDYEDLLLLDKVNELGHRWSIIGQHINGRSENDVKNRWYSHLKFRTTLDPETTRHVFVPPSLDDGQTRRRRNNFKNSPRQSAHKKLNEIRANEPVSSQCGEPFDIFDKHMSNDVTEDAFEIFGFGCQFDL